MNNLDSSTEAKLIKTFLREYIETHAQTLISMENSGLVHMIKNDKYDEVSLMYDLFSKCPESAFAAMSKSLSQFIVNEGQKLVSDDKLKHDEFVAKVIELREKMMNFF